MKIQLKLFNQAYMKYLGAILKVFKISMMHAIASLKQSQYSMINHLVSYKLSRILKRPQNLALQWAFQNFRNVSKNYARNM